MLTECEFATLVALKKHGTLTQRNISALIGHSLGATNQSLASLKQRELIDDAGITRDGEAALEPYRVKNAVILAAGFSSRLAPISYANPKGTLVVKGETLIDRQIEQLRQAGITNISIVVGYKKEKFFYLEDKYGVSIIINDEYQAKSNNYSLYLVREKLGNTYVCSSDNYFTINPFEEFVYTSYYAAVYHSGPTEEWCIAATKGKNNLITGVTRGGSDSWIMLGHAYMDSDFAKTFTAVLEEAHPHADTAGKLWEDLYLEHIERLPMVMRKYDSDVIWEFDSLDEIREFDIEFINNVQSNILDNICSTLECQREAISGIEPIKNGYTNLSFRFDIGADSYVYRHPGEGSEAIIDRKSETIAQKIGAELGIDGTFIHEDEETGWKISHYIADCVHFEYRNDEHLAQAMELIRRLHTSGRQSEYIFDIHEDTKKQLGLMGNYRNHSFPDFDELYELAEKLNEILKAEGTPMVLCHNDFYDDNFLVGPNRTHLIDWEFSAMSDYASDLGVFIACSDYSYEEGLKVFRMYFGRELTKEELFHCVAYTCVVAFHWLIWALYKESIDEPVGELLYFYYKHTKLFGHKAMALLEGME